MRNKSIHCFRLGERASRHSTGWLRAMRQIQSEEHPIDKTAHRLSRNFRTLDDWDRNDHGRSVNYRSWKRHSKCRRQWVEHDCPVIDPFGNCFAPCRDHRRKWILQQLRQHETCAFHIADDEFLRDALADLVDSGQCRIIWLVSNGRLCETESDTDCRFYVHYSASEVVVALAKPQQVAPKSSPKQQEVVERPRNARRERRKAKQLALKRRRQAIAAVEERRARARRNGHAAEWLNALPAQPTDGKIHDLLDFFFRSGLSENPLFSFKGRTFQRIEALMMQWHQQEKQQAMRHELELHWSYRGYSYQGDGNHVFRELTTGQALLDEGEAQHNCVFSYRHACVSGHTSIVSMRSIQTSARLTIEIDNSSRRIVQIREVCNRLPTNEELRVVRNFASAKNLAISC